jgi:hypothetical protein
MNIPWPQNSPDHGYAALLSNVLTLHDATKFIEYFDCMFIVGDKQSLQGFLKIINPSGPRTILQFRMRSNFAHESVDDITHDYSIFVQQVT